MSMQIVYLISPRIRIKVGAAADPTDPTDHRKYQAEARKAIELVQSMDAEQLKRLVVDGLIDADAYPLNFAEVESFINEEGDK